jgi:hypothetical protein
MRSKKKFTATFLTIDKDEDFRRSLTPMSEEGREHEFSKFVKFKDNASRRSGSENLESSSPMRRPNFQSSRNISTASELTGSELYARYRDKSFLVPER